MIVLLFPAKVLGICYQSEAGRLPASADAPPYMPRSSINETARRGWCSAQTHHLQRMFDAAAAAVGRCWRGQFQVEQPSTRAEGARSAGRFGSSVFQFTHSTFYYRPLTTEGDDVCRGGHARGRRLALKAFCVTHHHLKQVAGKSGLVHADGFRV